MSASDDKSGQPRIVVLMHPGSLDPLVVEGVVVTPSEHPEIQQGLETAMRKPARKDQERRQEEGEGDGHEDRKVVLQAVQGRARIEDLGGEAAG